MPVIASLAQKEASEQGIAPAGVVPVSWFVKLAFSLL
jgi:hypothetical protein